MYYQRYLLHLRQNEWQSSMSLNISVIFFTGVSVNGSVSTASVNGSVTASGNGTPSSTGPPVRELNYAELDLPKSNAIGFPQTVRQNGSTNKQPTLLNGSAAAVSFIHWVGIFVNYKQSSH